MFSFSYFEGRKKEIKSESQFFNYPNITIQVLGMGKKYNCFFWNELRHRKNEKKIVLKLEECMRETTLEVYILYIAILY